MAYAILLFIFAFRDSCNSAAAYIDHDYGQPDREKDCDAKGFLEKVLNSLKFRIIQLPSESNDVKKYNIVSNDNVQFVHIFLEQSSTCVSCMSGVCQNGFGKKRKLESLREHQNLCIHLEVFREFMIDSGDVQSLFFFIKENWICAMTRHHAESNINILLTRNLPIDSGVRQ